jgi:hypothetical protein
MKMLNLKGLVGIAALGGLAYAHKRRGGEWTLDSVKDTVRELWTTANAKLAPMKDELRESFERASSETAARSGMATEPRSYSYVKRAGDDTQH